MTNKDKNPKHSTSKVNNQEEEGGADVQELALRKFKGGRFFAYRKLAALVNAYMNKTKCEDVNKVEEFGGIEAILDKL